MKSLFVYNRHDLEAEVSGGVQLCSQEFLEIVQAASLSTDLVTVSVFRNWIYRTRRRFGLGAYLLYHPSECATTLARALEDSQPTHVFLNKAELIRLAPVIKRLRPQTRVVVMSHGTQSGDDLYEIAGPDGRRSRGLSRVGATWQLGLGLATESYYRHRWIDAVCVMSREEETLERWLGARTTICLPRIVRPSFLEWKPVPGRAGYVGTLDHTPNRVALEQICATIAKTGLKTELRLVGRPEAVGREFASKYPFVVYLGGLSEADLRVEARSWSLCLNPIFWLARGASMKLGQALALGLPVLTTRSGVRGYEARAGSLSVTVDNPVDFVNAMKDLLGDPGCLEECRRQSILFAESVPTAGELSVRLAAVAS